MKKYYYIYQVYTDSISWHEEFKEKEFSEHSAVQWIATHLKNPKYKKAKYIIKPIYEKSK